MAEITIRDIAKECGVGISTVSRALNNHPDINPETREKIMRVIAEKGFVPNNSARNLKRVETKTVALLIKGISNPFFTDMISVIEMEVEKRGYDLVLHHVESKENEVDVALELVKEKRLQGIIFLGGEFTHSDEKLAKLTVPFVFSTSGLNQKQIQKCGYASISVDDLAESIKVVDYLLDMGHKDIAIIAAQEDDMSVGKLRLDGYMQALEGRGITPKKDLITYLHKGEFSEEYTMDNGYRLTKELLAKNVKFTALFAISDTLALGALRAIREAGLSVPEDISVIGFDGIKLGDYSYPRISTLRQPAEDIALATVEMLCDIIGGKRENEQLLLAGDLVIRESTRPPKN